MLMLVCVNLSYSVRLNFNPPSDFLKVSSPHLVLIFSLLLLPDRRGIFLGQVDKAF